MTSDDILKEELEALRIDIIAVYNASGKRTSGEFEKGLELIFKPNSASLYGYLYLAGRKPGKMPPIKPILDWIEQKGIQPIEDWIEQKGIQPIEDKMKTSTLAYLIARKIGQSGTAKENHLAIFDKVITPERIDSILEKITKINITKFIDEVTVMITKLVENK